MTIESIRSIPLYVMFMCRRFRPGVSITKTIEAFFVRYRSYFGWLHVLMFLFFLLILFLPLVLPEPSENATVLTNFSTFANYILWGVWFPLVFISVIFTGRSWCGLLCPMGAASEWANKKGLQRQMPALIRWEGTPIVSFIIITLLGQTLGVRDHPEAAAGLFGTTLVIAIIIGFLYGRNKRAWCRHMCPIGLLLGVFSRLGAVQFVPKKKMPGEERYAEKTACPTMIDLAYKQESRHCIECFRCVNQNAKGGLALQLNRPGLEIENIRDHHPNISEIWFFFLGTGVAIGGFLWLILPAFEHLRQTIVEWFFNHEWFWIGESGPAWLMSVHPDRREVFTWLDFISITSFMLGFMVLFAAILLLTTGAAAWLSGRCGGDSHYRARFTELGYQYAPVAMVSLILGLGVMLFEPLQSIGFNNSDIGIIKGCLFLISLLWSFHLGLCILRRQGIPLRLRWLPMIPSAIGSSCVGIAWWPAIFGI